jgi:hypothetical protein
MNCKVKRRQLLKSFLVLPITACLAEGKAVAGGAPDVPPRDPGKLKQAPVRISVHAPGGKHFNGPAIVKLIGARSSYELPRKSVLGTGLYEDSVPIGYYRLEVQANGYWCPPNVLSVPSSGLKFAAYLGNSGWPTYRIGKSLIPYEPHEGVLAVLVPHAVYAHQVNLDAIRASMIAFGLQPYSVSGAKQRKVGAYDNHLAGDSIWLFSISAADAIGDIHKLRQSIARKIKKLLEPYSGGELVRVGMLVDSEEMQAKFIDEHFILRFHRRMSEAQARRMVKKGRARIIRRLNFAPNAWLIAFDDLDHDRHSKVVESWLKNRSVRYIEPDVIFEHGQHACQRFYDDPADVLEVYLSQRWAVAALQWPRWTSVLILTIQTSISKDSRIATTSWDRRRATPAFVANCFRSARIMECMCTGLCRRHRETRRPSLESRRMHAISQ